MPFNRKAKNIQKALYALVQCIKIHSDRRDCNIPAVNRGLETIAMTYDLKTEELRRLRWVVDSYVAAFIEEDSKIELTDPDYASVSLPRSRPIKDDSRPTAQNTMSR